MALEYQSVLSVRFLHTYVLLLIFSEARAVHESEFFINLCVKIATAKFILLCTSYGVCVCTVTLIFAVIIRITYFSDNLQSSVSHDKLIGCMKI